MSLVVKFKVDTRSSMKKSFNGEAHEILPSLNGV